MLRDAYEHQDAGRPVFIVTAASNEMAEMLAHVLVFDGGIGTRSEIEDGVYTGRPGGPVHLSRRARPRRSREWPRSGASTCPSPTPTPTASPTCRCSSGGQPGGGEPRLALLAIARERGWRDDALRQARRRLKIARGAGAVGLRRRRRGLLAARLKPRGRG